MLLLSLIDAQGTRGTRLRERYKYSGLLSGEVHKGGQRVPTPQEKYQFNLYFTQLLTAIILSPIEESDRLIRITHTKDV
ncbi:hypothetical protein NIES4075_59570 [Tolypothrix sp. NIES-4075]|nr:hypothetical protein NIES4075_59570 [Tolypothrix sp. NIES-4075]